MYICICILYLYVYLHLHIYIGIFIFLYLVSSSEGCHPLHFCSLRRICSKYCQTPFWLPHSLSEIMIRRLWCKFHTFNQEQRQVSRETIQTCYTVLHDQEMIYAKRSRIKVPSLESKSLRRSFWSGIALASRSDHSLTLSFPLPRRLLRLLVLLHLHLRLLHLLLHSVKMTQGLLPVLGAVALYLD